MGQGFEDFRLPRQNGGSAALHLADGDVEDEHRGLKNVQPDDLLTRLPREMTM